MDYYFDYNAIVSKRIPVTELKSGDKLVYCNRIYGVTEVIPEGGEIFVDHDFGEFRFAADRHVQIEV